MKHTLGTPSLTDSALDNHIDELQSQLDQLQISLQLATDERKRRIEKRSISSAHPFKEEDRSEPPNHQFKRKQTQTTSDISTALCVGSTVRIRNRYRGNKGKVGKIIQLSSKTATVHIPNDGTYIKYLHNLELLST